jgi:Family of unknown function (DUF6802)
VCRNRTHDGAGAPTVPVVPDVAPDLTIPDPAPGAHPPGDPDGVPGTDPPGTAWGPPGAALLTGDLVPGEPVLGAPTVDSDADGTPDTAVAEVADQLVLATDLDHDGRADAVTRIGPDAVTTTRAGDAGHEQLDRPWDAPPPPPPSVDPRTGAWIRG